MLEMVPTCLRTCTYTSYLLCKDMRPFSKREVYDNCTVTLGSLYILSDISRLMFPFIISKDLLIFSLNSLYFAVIFPREDALSAQNMLALISTTLLSVDRNRPRSHRAVAFCGKHLTDQCLYDC